MKKPIFFILILMSCQYSHAQYWQPLQAGLGWYTTCLYEDSISNQLFVGGRFKTVNNQTQWGIATYNGSQWGQLGAGIDDSSFTNSPSKTTSIVRYGSAIYVGGWFGAAGGLNTPALAQWDGNNWDTVPGALMKTQDIVNDMLVFNNELYICGAFDSVGNVPANCIAKWNGTTWSAIGPNYPFLPNGASVNKIAVYHGNLYAIGWFFDPLNNFCRLAKWDGNNWTFFSNAFTNVGAFNDMIVYNDKLYVGGLFSMPGAKTAIMTWNDTVWCGVGGGVQVVNNANPTVIDLLVHGGKLYCVGNFEKIGGVPARGLASWDGTVWCGYNTFFAVNNQDIGAMNIAFYRDTMYVGGGFITVNGDSMNYISKWIGGNYVDTCGVISTGIQEEFMLDRISIYPNPATEIITFQFFDAHQSRSIIIYDQLGREVWREETDESSIALSVAEFAEGIYFYSIQSIIDGTTTSGKLIITR